MTNKDGRCSSLIERKEFLAGRYKLHFDTDRYFELERKETLYPFVEVWTLNPEAHLLTVLVEELASSINHFFALLADCF